MRPYLAVIKDSFREALSSRVLWILLVLATVLLLVIVPVGLHEQAGTSIQPRDLIDAAGLIGKLKTQQAAQRPSPGKQVWSLLSDDLQSRMKTREEPGGGWPGQTVFQLSRELDAMLAERELYDASAWDGVELTPEAEQLLEKGAERLDDQELKRLNRHLVQAAFPNEIAASSQTQTSLTYLGMQALGPFSVPREAWINSALMTFISFFAGTIGVFAAILVTASIIPQTFDAGAIDLLLSKPISRALLYVAKFLGGCAFIAINALYLVGGLWLIVGLRFGTWSTKLLWCVPLLMFLFAIYYSVSALAGVVWKNAIVSVVISVLFWAICFTVGTAKTMIEFIAINPARLIKLVPAGEALLAVDEGGDTYAWESKSRTWKSILAPAGSENRPPRILAPSPPVGPLYDAENKRLFALPPQYQQFGLGQAPRLIVAQEADSWKRADGISAPGGTAALLMEPRGTLLAVSPAGVFRLKGNPTDTAKQVKVLGFDLPLGPAGGSFAPAGDAMRFRVPLAAAIDARSGDVAVYDGEKLSILTPDTKGKYSASAERQFKEPVGGVLALGGSGVVLGLADGRLRIYRRSGSNSKVELELVGEHRPEGKNGARSVEAGSDGRFFAVLFHHRKLWLYDAQRKTLVEPDISRQGDFSAAVLAGPDRLLAADRVKRVSEYTVPGFDLVSRREPAGALVERIYRYGVKPIYTVFPKPGELDNVVNYLLTDEESVATGPDADDPRAARMRLDVWGPVWSSLAFMAVMVGLGALYTQRKDF
ncbi:MAG: ABC transporter permease [Pirellulales bacterium]